MISKNLSRRLERLEDSLLPALEEPVVIRIISVSPDGRREDSGIEFKVPAVPKPFKKRPLVKAIASGCAGLRANSGLRTGSRGFCGGVQGWLGPGPGSGHVYPDPR